MARDQATQQGQNEIQQLKNTAIALRERLDLQQVEFKQQIQSLTISKTTPIIDLQNTIQELRSLIQFEQNEKNRLIQVERQKSHEEIQQLKETISNLRHQIDQPQKA
jgi:hypothetical protein